MYMQKKIWAALLALMFLASGLAEASLYEGDGYAIALPEGLEVLSEEAVAGYFAGAAADVSGVIGEDEPQAVDLDAIMMAASADGKTSVNINFMANDGKTAVDSATAAAAELEALVEGLNAPNVTETAYGDHAFACIRYALYGNDVSQYFTVAGERLYCVTCTNMAEADIEAMLLTFAPEA